MSLIGLKVVNLREIGILCYAYVCPPSCIQWPCSKKNYETRCECHQYRGYAWQIELKLICLIVCGIDTQYQRSQKLMQHFHKCNMQLD